MAKSKVAMIRCERDDEPAVSAAILRGVGLLGGISSFIKPSEHIVLKPNLLIASSPEKSVTTHPAVFKAIGLLLQKAGAALLYGDSPSIGACEWSFKKAGLKQI